jgi:HAT1-interacting factor 1
VAKLLAEGKKALALSQWEEAIEKHASALEIQYVGLRDPRMS